MRVRAHKNPMMRLKILHSHNNTLHNNTHSPIKNQQQNQERVATNLSFRQPAASAGWSCRLVHSRPATDWPAPAAPATSPTNSGGWRNLRLLDQGVHRGITSADINHLLSDLVRKFHNQYRID